MKIFIFGMLVLSLSAMAKEVKDFNRVLIQNVQEDIIKDNIQTFEKSKPGRMPASVVEEGQSEKTIKEEPKFDKMNNRQIGPNKW